jgi:hypothetical protein
MTAHSIFVRALFTVRVLWFALTFSCALLGLVTVMVPGPGKPVLDATMEAVFAVVALGLAIASFVIPARMYAAMGRSGGVEKSAPEPTAGGLGPARFAAPEQAARHAVGVGNTMLILAMALSEAVGLLGLVLHMQGAPMTVSSAFIAAGFLLAAFRFPTITRLVGPYERAKGASFAASEGGSY